MNDTEVAVADASAGKKNLTAKTVKRRISRINAGTTPSTVRKKKGKLAANILAQIAAGRIKNPVAVAKAFASGNAAPANAAED